MNWKCFFIGCDWKLIGLQIGKEILIQHRCERCRAERWRTAE